MGNFQEKQKEYKVKIHHIQQNKRRNRYTLAFDDKDELKQFAKSLLQCRITKIRLWYGIKSTLVVNGIQLTYKNLDNWKELQTKPQWGSDQTLGYKDYTLYESEFIEKADIKIREGIIDQLNLHTNKKRTICKGEGEGIHKSFSINKGHVIIGTKGRFLGHLRNIGFYVAPIEDVKFWKRRSYILLKAWIERNKDFKKSIRKKIKQRIDDKNYWPDVSFLLLVTQGHQLFVKIMCYM